MPVATLPDGTVRYRDLGDPGARPVVFVHGALVDSRLWDGVAERLAAGGLRAVLPDWPLGAHREPMPADAELTPAGVAGMVLAFLDELDLRDACLVGNDTGGAVVQMALARQAGEAGEAEDPGAAGAAGAEAGRVTRAVFTNCDTFDRFPPPPFDLMFRLARLPGAVPLMFRLASLGPLGRVGFRPLVASPLDHDLVRSWLEPGRTDGRIRADVRRFLRSVDPADLVAAAERLDRFAGEVLVAWAPEDRYFRIADGRRLAACFRSSRVVEIPGSRTFVALDQPERLAAEIAAFCGAGAGDAGPATSGSPPASA